MKKLLAALATAASLTLGSGAASAAGAAVDLPSFDWSFKGLFGTFDRAATQRGLLVYKEVCAGCHALSLVAYRSLGDLGLSEDEVKAIAAAATVVDGPNDEGEMFERAGKPSDHFVSPFPNKQAARAANGGAYPPDLSLIVKARAGGADYLKALLIGYEEAPADFKLGNGMHYNKYFAGHQIAMPNPISSDGLVEYADGTNATVQQMASDVTYFLAWASEPELEERKQMGVKVIIFLLVFTGIAYASKRKVWAHLH